MTSYIPAIRTSVVQGSVPSLHQGPPIIQQRVVQGAPRLIGGLQPMLVEVNASPVVPLIQAQTLPNFTHLQPFPLFQFDQNVYANEENALPNSFTLSCIRKTEDEYYCKISDIM
jgi:hypothetical protein